MVASRECPNIPEMKFAFNEEYFCKILEEIDKELQKEGVVPRMRLFLALKKIGEKIPEVGRVPILSGGAKNVTAIGYTSHNLAIKISEWFSLKYEQRMQMGDSVVYGRMIIMVEGEPYTIDMTVNFGSIQIIWQADYKQYPDNILNLPQKMKLSKVIAGNISRDDINKLCMVYKRTYDAFYKYHESGMEYVFEALEDERNAIDGIIQSERYGQSKWASLQFTEKLIKGIYFQKAGKKAPYSHKLVELGKLLSPYNLFIDEDVCRKIDCKPGIRYGEDGEVSCHEALDAHIASMKVFRFLTSKLHT